MTGMDRLVHCELVAASLGMYMFTSNIGSVLASESDNR